MIEYASVPVYILKRIQHLKYESRLECQLKSQPILKMTKET